MNLKDLQFKIKEFWDEFKKSNTGLLGLGLLVFLSAAVIFERVIVPFPEANRNWSEIGYWSDEAQGAKPVWTNFFSSEKLPKSQNVDIKGFEVEETERLTQYKTEFVYSFNYDSEPNDIIMYFDTVGRMIINVEVERPDGEVIRLERKTYNTEELTTNRYSVLAESLNGAYRFATAEDYDNASNVQRNTVNPVRIIFSEVKERMLQDPVMLKGDYIFRVTGLAPGGNGELVDIDFRVVGKVSGLMGTDLYKRDIYTGLIAGVKWAMLIGLLISFLSTVIGVTYGITSAYFGGMIDAVMMRIAEFLMNIPFLPIMIALSAIFKPSIWIFIGLMCALRWVGSVRTVRSMGMQIKNETFIEASKALGASHTRLIFKHMIPIMIPFAFSSMALAVPGAILTEASISIIGLGDSTIITWGQMLNDARTAGAVIQGMWWWIIPPGLMISIVGMSFAFVGFAMDKILNPKLKSR